MEPAVIEPDASRFAAMRDIPRMVRAEVLGLTDEQLDFESDRWEWAGWSIRRQVSHMASLVYRWILVRWGDQVFPDGHGMSDQELTALAASPYDRRLDETVFWDINDIELALQNALAFSQGVLGANTASDMRSKTLDVHLGPYWSLMRQAHPYGIEPLDDEGRYRITLEATFRHMYFEHITHLYNIQRLKRAQGLISVVELPEMGYWVLPGWDRSEP